MRVDLFGVGVRSRSPMISAESRVNCYVERRQHADKTEYALVGTPGLSAFCTSIGANPSRGMWPVNTLATPLTFSVHNGTLFGVNGAGVATALGTIGTTSGNVSMTDDGTNLMITDGTSGYFYNMLTATGPTQITDGNFPANPRTCTWQDTYFMTHNGLSKQFALSKNADPSTWPAVNQNFTGSGGGAIQAMIADHSVLDIFGDVYAEFWQDTGSPDFPYAVIPGSAQEYGLASPWALCKYDNSLAGLFTNKMGGSMVARMAGFRLEKISNQDIENILQGYSTVSDAVAFGYMLGGHPMLVLAFPTVGKTWMYDGFSRVWSELQATDGTRHWAHKFANFQGKLLVSDYRNGNIYKLDPTVYTDNGSTSPMEVTTKHIWQDDKMIGIPMLQVDVEAGVGMATGQGSNPQVDLLVSKDGGNTFTSKGFASIGAIGQYTQRVTWKSLGAAKDWVLKLRITDPVKRVITGATADIRGASF